jgi:hypothetical protein
MGSSFGGARVMGVWGSNLPAMVMGLYVCSMQEGGCNAVEFRCGQTSRCRASGVDCDASAPAGSLREPRDVGLA